MSSSLGSITNDQNVGNLLFTFATDGAFFLLCRLIYWCFPKGIVSRRLTRFDSLADALLGSHRDSGTNCEAPNRFGYPRWFEYLRTLLKLDEEHLNGEVKVHAGGLMYLRFHQITIILLLLVSVWSLVVSLTINYTSYTWYAPTPTPDPQPSPDWLWEVAMTHLAPGSPFIYVPFASFILVASLFFYFSWQFSLHCLQIVNAPPPALPQNPAPEDTPVQSRGTPLSSSSQIVTNYQPRTHFNPAAPFGSPQAHSTSSPSPAQTPLSRPSLLRSRNHPKPAFVLEISGLPDCLTSSRLLQLILHAHIFGLPQAPATSSSSASALGYQTLGQCPHHEDSADLALRYASDSQPSAGESILLDRLSSAADITSSMLGRPSVSSSSIAPRESTAFSSSIAIPSSNPLLLSDSSSSSDSISSDHPMMSPKPDVSSALSFVSPPPSASLVAKMSSLQTPMAPASIPLSSDPIPSNLLSARLLSLPSTTVPSPFVFTHIALDLTELELELERYQQVENDLEVVRRHEENEICCRSSSKEIQERISHMESERKRSQRRLLALVNESWRKTFEEDEINSGVAHSLSSINQSGYRFDSIDLNSFASSCFRRGTSYAYVGFVDYESAEKARFFLESHPLNFPLSIFPSSAFTKRSSSFSNDSDSLEFLSSENSVPLRVAVRPAPPMADLVWPHLAWSSWNRAIRISIANILLLILVVAFTAFTLLPRFFSLDSYTLLMHCLRKSQDLWNTQNTTRFDEDCPDPQIDEYYLLFQAITVYLVKWVFLPTAIWLCAMFERPIQLSVQEKSTFHKYCLYMFLISLVVPSISSTANTFSIKGIIEFVCRLKVNLGKLSDFATAIGNMYYSHTGRYILIFLLHSTFIASGMRLANIPQITLRWWRLSRAQTANEIFAANMTMDFDVTFYWAARMSILGIILAYGSTVPLAYPAGLLYFVINYYVDRFVMLNGTYSMSLPATWTAAELESEQARALALARVSLKRMSQSVQTLQTSTPTHAQLHALGRLPRAAMRVLALYLVFTSTMLAAVLWTAAMPILSYSMMAFAMLLALISLFGPWHATTYAPRLGRGLWLCCSRCCFCFCMDDGSDDAEVQESDSFQAAAAARGYEQPTDAASWVHLPIALPMPPYPVLTNSHGDVLSFVSQSILQSALLVSSDQSNSSS